MMVLLSTIMDHARQLAQTFLTVIGAALIGAIAIGIFANYVSLTVSSKKLNPSILRIIRILGGLSTGFVVSMMMLSGSGGWGLGGGSGTGQSGTQSTPPTKLAAEVDVAPASTEPTFVHVTMLGGARVNAERFYQVDGHTQAMTIAELQSLIKSMPISNKTPLTLRIYDDSVAQDHPAVVVLETWLRDQNWRVNIEKIPGTIPAPAGVKP
jgi:hypothetical protein